MYKFLSDYCRTFDEKLNLPLINRELDKELYIYVYETIKSLEVFDSIKILGYEYNENPNDIKLNDYIRTRSQNGKKVQEDPVEVMYMSESRCGELKIHYELSIDVKQEDGTTKMMSKTYDFFGVNAYYNGNIEEFTQFIKTMESLLLKPLLPFVKNKLYSTITQRDIQLLRKTKS